MEDFNYISSFEMTGASQPIERGIEKLVRLKQAIEEGNYQIDSKELANIMIAKMILQKLSSPSI